MILSAPFGSHLPMSPECSHPSSSSTSLVFRSSFRYPWNTLGPLKHTWGEEEWSVFCSKRATEFYSPLPLHWQRNSSCLARPRVSRYCKASVVPHVRGRSLPGESGWHQQWPPSDRTPQTPAEIRSQRHLWKSVWCVTISHQEPPKHESTYSFSHNYIRLSITATPSYSLASSRSFFNSNSKFSRSS